MKILLVHNHYRQRSGEDQVFAAEAELLEQGGLDVLRYTRDNAELQDGGVRVGARAIWNRQVHAELVSLIRTEEPDVVHLHNTLAMISPAAHHAAASCGAAVVQTLHNYRLFCPGGVFFRDGRVCEDCTGRPLLGPAVLHACYRQSRAASAALSAQLVTHRALGTWRRAVDVFVALTGFSRDKFVECGLPAERIAVKPNFAPDPGVGSGAGGYALFVGRLSEEKGLDVLLEALARLGGRLPARIVGDGPLAPRVREAAARLPGVTWLGSRSLDEIYALLRDAACLVVPSLWYEHFPRVIVEAFASGTPVVASRIGALAEIVRSGENGLHFAPGDPEDLAAQLEWARGRPDALAEMRRRARGAYETSYTPARNLELLTKIYADAVDRAQQRSRDAAPSAVSWWGGSWRGSRR